MKVHQYTHLDPSDTIAVKHVEGGATQVAINADGEPKQYLFLSREQTESLRVGLDTPERRASDG